MTRSIKVVASACCATSAAVVVVERAVVSATAEALGEALDVLTAADLGAAAAFADVVHKRF